MKKDNLSSTSKQHPRKCRDLLDPVSFNAEVVLAELLQASTNFVSVLISIFIG
jgi:hypothetical protein